MRGGRARGPAPECDQNGSGAGFVSFGLRARFGRDFSVFFGIAPPTRFAPPTMSDACNLLPATPRTQAGSSRSHRSMGVRLFDRRVVCGEPTVAFAGRPICPVGGGLP